MTAPARWRLTARLRLTARWRLPAVAIPLLLCSLLVFYGLTPLVGQAQTSSDARRSLFPVTRSAREQVRRAAALVGNHDYARATELLSELFLTDDDFFLSESLFDDPEREVTPLVYPATFSRTFRGDLADWLGRWDQEGRDLYELAMGGKAEQMYQDAIRAVPIDCRALSQVFSRYRGTPSGRKAGLLLAQLRLERGWFDSAARILTDLLRLPVGERAGLEPTLSMDAALAALGRGDSQLATDHIQALFHDYGEMTVELAGEPVSDAGELQTRLETLASTLFRKPNSDNGPRSASSGDAMGSDATASDVTDDSSDSAAGSAADAFPVLVWSDLLSDRDRATLRREWTCPKERHGLADPALPGPVADEGVLFYRDHTDLVARQLSDGTLLWHAGLPEVTIPESLKDDYQYVEADIWTENARYLVAGDRTTASLVLDGDLVFSVDPPLNLPRRVRESTQGPNARPLPDLTGGNTLVARKVQDGEVAWMLGQVPYGNAVLAVAAADPESDPDQTGKAGFELAVEEAADRWQGQLYFCGSPLVEGPLLYIIAEDAFGPLLLSVQRETGQVTHRVRLASSPIPITRETTRSGRGVSPVAVAGTYLCPGTSGELAAIDRDTLDPAWLFASVPLGRDSGTEDYREAIRATRSSFPDPALTVSGDPNEIRLMLPGQGTRILASGTGELLRTEESGESRESGSQIVGHFLVHWGSTGVQVWGRSGETERGPVSAVRPDSARTFPPEPRRSGAGTAIADLGPLWPAGKVLAEELPATDGAGTPNIMPGLGPMVSVSKDHSLWRACLAAPVLDFPLPEASLGDRIVRVDPDGAIRALDQKTDEQIWSVPEAENEVTTHLAWSRDRLFRTTAASTGEFVIEMDPQTGKTIQEKEYPERLGPWTGSLACLLDDEQKGRVVALADWFDHSDFALDALESTDSILRLPEQNLLVLYRGNGEMAFYDTQSGSLLFRSQLDSPEAAGEVGGLDVFRDREGLLVLVRYRPRNILRFSGAIESIYGPDEERIEYGRCQRFGLDGTPCWPEPVALYDTYYMRTQPADSPVLLLIKKVSGTRQGDRLAIRAIDKRTGTVRFNAALPACDVARLPNGRYPIYAEQDRKAAVVILYCQDRAYRFRFTDEEQTTGEVTTGDAGQGVTNDKGITDKGITDGAARDGAGE